MAAGKLQKRRQRVFELRRAAQHLVGDAGQADDLRRQPALRIDKGLEGVRYLAVLEHYGADLGDRFLLDVEACCLDVEADDFRGKVSVLCTVHGDAIINIIEIIALTAVKYFYFTLACVPGIWKGLGNAVVGNGDGGHAPLRRKIHNTLCVGQRVHIGHLGVQVQLHALFFRIVHTALVCDLGDVARVELHILAVVGQLHRPADTQPHALRHALPHRLDLSFEHVAPHDDRAGVVRHLDHKHPHARAPCFVAVELEHLALHHHAARLGVELAHRQNMAFDLAAEDDLAGRTDLLSLAGRIDRPRKRLRLGADDHLIELIALGKQHFQRVTLRLRQILARRHVQRERTLFRFQHHVCHQRTF